MYWAYAAGLGTICGAVLSGFLLMNMGASGLSTLVDIVSLPAVGALSASYLGVYTGITGGIVGGLVAVGLNILPVPNWLFVSVPLGALITKLAVAAVLSWMIALSIPH